ncbi:MAG: 6,7-dimethyl-8-ribityllumazine synthase [Flavobacteriia bacterium]|nr:6,7-dimethyl-8-ribityllumazine synthase [Flavobacteriia bacterium]
MATEGHNLSEYDLDIIKGCADFDIGIVVSQWNADITHSLAKGAMDVFKTAGITSIKHISVPGSFELPLAAQMLLTKHEFMDGVIVIGNVIQGETKHFDYVCQGLTQGVMDVMLKFNKPVSFCVLTDQHKQQSMDRSGGKLGNKGIECAVALLQMIKLQK